MAQVDHYRRCSDAARAMPREKFALHWPGHYLLVTIPGGDVDDWDIGFTTNVVSIDKLGTIPAPPAADEEEEEAPGTYLFEIKKHADNTWLEWIAVGRARNNDLILRHQSVSKLHARVHREKEAGAAAADRGRFWLTDLKSTAGTAVNGTLLAPSKPFPLTPGDEIRFGMVTCEFLDPAALHRRLTASDW
jgi:hypothetical protein